MLVFLSFLRHTHTHNLSFVFGTRNICSKTKLIRTTRPDDGLSLTIHTALSAYAYCVMAARNRRQDLRYLSVFRTGNRVVGTRENGTCRRHTFEKRTWSVHKSVHWSIAKQKFAIASRTFPETSAPEQ